MSHYFVHQGRGGGLTTAGVVLCILCGPCLCALIPLTRPVKKWYKKAKAYESPKTRQRKKKEMIESWATKEQPRILPPRIGNERFLSIGRDDMEAHEIEPRNKIGNGKNRDKGNGRAKFKGSRPTSAQDNSPLFHCFPAEVRRMIWIEVVGGYLLHMRYVEAYKRIAHGRCKHEFGDAACGTEKCSHLMKQKGARDKWGNVDLLALLQTCRRIYSETIDLLYSANTFRFVSLSDVMNFSLQVHPMRMELMKNVRWKVPPQTMRIWRNGVGWVIEEVGGIDEPYSTTTPWLECDASDACECIECWQQNKSLAIVNGDYLAKAERNVTRYLGR